MMEQISLHFRLNCLEKIRAAVIHMKDAEDYALILHPILYQDLSHGNINRMRITSPYETKKKVLEIPILIDPEMPVGQFALEDTVTKERTYFKL